VRGSNLQAENSIEVTAGDIEILAGTNASSNNEHQQQVNYSYRWDLLGDQSSQDEDQLGGSFGGSGSRSDSETTHNINSQLLARNVHLIAKKDTTIKGADIHAGETLEIITENLHVASVQDLSFSESRTQGLSLSREGGGINTAEGENEDIQTLTTRLSGQQVNIKTLTTRLSGQQVNIKVGQHSEIQGAVIAAVDEEGADNGQLAFTTNTLTAVASRSTISKAQIPAFSAPISIIPKSRSTTSNPTRA
jgi:filamentous hemagglutinin